MPRRTLARAALAVGAAVAALALVEVALRVAGFSFRLRPEDIEFGAPSREQIRAGFVEDPDLFWVGRDYADRLEAIARTKPCIVFLGDSCTQFGRYDDALLRRVREAPGGRPVTGAAVGVAGWSSWQGRRALERDVLPHRPRIVTVYFGWNDHWVGYGIEDARIARLPELTSSPLGALRIGQWLTKLRVAREIGTDRFPHRVSDADFGANLAAMVRSARAAGAEPVLLTAPSAHVPGRTPEYLRERWLRPGDDLVEVHGRYADVVRATARAEGAPLVDLAAEMRALPQSELDAVHFQADGIHLTPAGNEKIGEILHAGFVRLGLVQRLLD